MKGGNQALWRSKLFGRSRGIPVFAFVVLFISLQPIGVGGSSFHRHQQNAKPRTTILISLDGFRWDYLTRGLTPNLQRLINKGVRAEALLPVFPADTFPNHYSIVTGLYPEHHGIVANLMYDPDLNAHFVFSDKSVAESKWWGGEPIWITAEKQGLKSGCFFWVGSEAEIKGVRPSFWKRYDKKVPNQDRVDEVLGWLKLSDNERPSFISLYFSDTDQMGHKFGPDSPEVQNAIRAVDESIGQLISGLDQLGILNQTNVLVVSDHGMLANKIDQTIFLEDFVNLSDVDMTWSDALVHIWPRVGQEDLLYRALAKIPHLKVYRKSEIPKRYHYRANRRIPPLIGVADVGWVVTGKRPKNMNVDELRKRTFGAHGYDPRNSSMWGIFIASGPDFRQGLVVKAFQNIEVYNLLASVLHIKPAPNDGNLKRVRKLLKD